MFAVRESLPGRVVPASPQAFTGPPAGRFPPPFNFHIGRFWGKLRGFRKIFLRRTFQDAGGGPGPRGPKRKTRCKRVFPALVRSALQQKPGSLLNLLFDHPQAVWRQVIPAVLLKPERQQALYLCPALLGHHPAGCPEKIIIYAGNQCLNILSGKVASPPDAIPAQADSFNGLFLGNRRKKSGRNCRLLLWKSTMEPITNPQR